MINDRESIPCLALHCIALQSDGKENRLQEGRKRKRRRIAAKKLILVPSVPTSGTLAGFFSFDFFSVWPIWAFWSCWSSFLPPFGLAQLVPG
jgi:hypothetical protein